MRRLTVALLASAVSCGLIIGCQSLPGATPPPSETVTVAEQTPASAPTALPNRDGSLKFGVLGDFGTGSREQYQLAEQMVALHKRFPYELVALVGDNLYGSERPRDFETKFERPYKALLDANVKFYAALGNHDDVELQRNYKLFNMDGKRYYTFKAPKQDVRFFVLESTYPEPEQVKWIEQELANSKEDWKIVYFHHPLYSSGYRHGSDVTLRQTLEPLFIKYNVSIVLTGHDHLYERIKPQQGISHFVVGSGGQLRAGGSERGLPFSAKIVDNIQVFLVAEIFENEMTFNAISRTGAIVDSGIVVRRELNAGVK